ncbi:MAG: MBL fold metallo-hydrolase [Candidatus Susulua stagnicola]|nr:MBL fold metallo-hydrolase [Candidatus Susulua stagnicola]
MGFIKFLGTAGGRFVVMKQLRASGGIWLQYKDTNVFIDPGPGALVKCCSSRPKLNPGSLDAIILTHKHLDHSNDLNVMIEAMTEGGFKKRGLVFTPTDALGEGGVVHSYLMEHPKEIKLLKKGKFEVRDINFEVPIKNIHSVETYGLKFYLGDEIVSFVSDTKYFDGLIDAYKDSTILILNVVFYKRRDEFEHLCLEDAIEIIRDINPKKAILTHFGMSMLKEKPHLLEEKINTQLKQNVKFANDGFSLEF